MMDFESTTQGSPKVTAMIVTYRRPALLLRCLAAVQAQTYQCHKIVVIDNCSGDDTVELVKQNFPSVEIMALERNGGCGEGFHIGLDRGLRDNGEWFWLMDDDGVPAQDCLEQLVLAQARTGLRVVGPLVCSCENPEQMCFPVRHNGQWLTTVAEIRTLEADGFIPDMCAPWNGILVHRSVPQQVGLPKAEMFIWGEEQEYMFRIQKARIPMGAISAARLIHPPDKRATMYIGIFGMRAMVYLIPDARRRQIFIRNEAYNAWLYRGPVRLLKHILKYSVLAYKTSGLSGVRTTLSHCLDGIRGVWELPA